MRLGVLLDRTGPAAGGAEAHTDALLRRALERGFSARVARLEGPLPPGVEPVALGRVPRGRPARDRHLATAGPAALRAAGCDVVYAVRHALACDVYLPHGGLVADAWAARDATHGAPGPLGRLAAWASRKRRFFLEAERALLGGPTGPRVIALSRLVARRVADVYPAARARVTVVPNGVDTERFCPLPPADAAAARGRTRAGLAVPDGAYVGLLVAHDPWLKGLATVLDAMADPAVAALAPGFHLVVAGKRAGEAVVAAGRRGLAGRVHAAGAVDDPRPLYAAADVLVQPTWHDPCSLTCLEALACGLPVVTTTRNGVSELMGPRGGIAVERPGDPEAVAHALRVLADPALRAATADDARYVAQKHRLPTRLDQVLDVCLGPAAPRPAAPAEAEDEGPPADPSLAPEAR